MTLSNMSVPGINPIHTKAVPLHKQDQYIHACWIKLEYNFNISIGYPIGALWKLYEYNQEVIKILFSDMITPQDSPLDVLTNALHSIYLWDQTCNFLTSTPNPMEEKSLRALIGCVIGFRFYPLTGSKHHKLIRLDRFHRTNHRQVHSYDKPD